MFTKDPDVSFKGVAFLLIIIGAVLFVFGGVAWLFNFFGNSNFVYPSVKIMGGLVIMALGYIQLELELLRKK